MEGKGRKSKAEKRVLEGIIQKAKNWQLSFTKTPSHVSMPSHLIFLPNFFKDCISFHFLMTKSPVAGI